MNNRQFTVQRNPIERVRLAALNVPASSISLCFFAVVAESVMPPLWSYTEDTPPCMLR